MIHMAAIGIDIGGSKIALGLVEGNKILCRSVLSNTYFGDPDRMLEDITEEINRLHVKSPSILEGVGVGCPGWVIRGTVYEDIHLGIKKYDLGIHLGRACGLSTFVENDARTALLCEKEYGSLRESVNGALVTLGTGIGGALLLHRQLYTGSFGYAGEIGHMTIGSAGDACSCGKRGCFELYGSVSALVWMAQEAGLTVENGLDVFTLDEQGSSTAANVLSTYIQHIAAGIIELAMLLDLDTVSIGGAISQQWNRFVYPLQEAVKQFAPLCTVVPSTYHNDAGIIGAALLVE